MQRTRSTKVTPIKELIKQTFSLSIKKFKKDWCGEKLGEGVYREVYVLKANPRCIVKIEKNINNTNFSNVLEHHIWNTNCWDKSLRQWLAPVIAINTKGTILIQKRIKQYKNKEYPSQIPSNFTDVKRSNFGYIGKRFVCCDYGNMMLKLSSNKRNIKWKYE